jgi:hypothetical protein
MRRRNAGRGCAVVSYGHGWNNVAIQLGGAPEIAYRDPPVDARRLEQLISQRAWPCGRINLRDHGRIATGANAHDSAGQCEQLLGIRRAVVRSHFETKSKKERLS